ncbi:hypothetical protein KP509_02G044300 [Ceratopteris richardii]|nr:hypothetical protein KP509_02G044300 [Ceratopteris richardii]
MKEASRLKNVHRRALKDKVGVALGIMKGKEMKEIDEVQNSIISSQLDSRDYGVDDGHAEPSTFSISEQAASDLGGDINLSTSSSLPDMRKPREASGDEWKGQNVLRRSPGIENRSVDLLQDTRAETAPNEGNLPATIRSTSQHPFTNPVTDLRSDFSKGPSYGTHGARKLPPDLLTRPSYSSSQPPQTPSSPTSVSDSLVKRMKSPYLEDQEAAVAEARQLSREQKNRRSLCSADIVAALIELFQSKNVKVQVDAIAALVNLSIENQNKSMIVQAGALPFLIEVLNSGCPEAQEHAAAAAFTLAIADESKHSMGILNAIPPLLKILNFGPEGARQDAAMALYHLSLMQSNKSKLIKSGAIPILFNLAQSTERLGLVSKVLMVLVNVASVPEGRAALLQMNPIPALVRLLQI